MKAMVCLWVILLGWAPLLPARADAPGCRYEKAVARYGQGRYGAARREWRRSKAAPGWAEAGPYRLVEARFRQGRYKKAAKEGKALLEHLSSVRYPGDPGAGRKSRLHRVVGEACFRSGDYAGALEHLIACDRLRGAAAVPPEEHYMQGYGYYVLGNCREALYRFSRVGGADGILRQRACYYAGLVHGILHEDYKALASFGRAAEMDGDPVLTEDALYRWAVLHVGLAGKVGAVRREDALRAVRRYLEAYPKGPRSPEMRKRRDGLLRP